MTSAAAIYSYWQGGHLGGLIFVLLLPAILAGLMGERAPAAVHAMGLFILVALPVGAVLAHRLRAEVARPAWRGAARLGGFPAACSAIQDLRLLLIADVSVNLAAGATGTLFRFFAEEARGFSDTDSSLGLLVYFITGLLALPLWLRLAKRIGKARDRERSLPLYGALVHMIAFTVFDADELWRARSRSPLPASAMPRPGFCCGRCWPIISKRRPSGAASIGRAF